MHGRNDAQMGLHYSVHGRNDAQMGSLVSSHASSSQNADAAFAVLPHLARSRYLSAVPAKFVDRVTPVPVSAPRLVLFNDALAEELEIDAVRAKTAEGAAVFGGNAVHHSWEPYAQAYSGHQFRKFAQLGDGRAVVLGTLRGIEVQLKGSGHTRYSRGGDGRATLASVYREYIVSEAMHALGIPTTRSLACVDTGDHVARGGARERGGVLTRTSPGFVRIGTFERLSRRSDLLRVSDARVLDSDAHALKAGVSDSFLDFSGARVNPWDRRAVQDLQALADFVIAENYSVHAGPTKYRDFCLDVCAQYGALVAAWMCVGFVHGVMNTDNVLVSRVATLDYGPCAFLDEYDPQRVFSSIDRAGLYCFANQPAAGAWNCTRLLRALKRVESDEEAYAGSVDVAGLTEGECTKAFHDAFLHAWERKMAAKIGIAWASPADTALVRELLRLMESVAADYTLTFRELADTHSLSAPVFQKWVGAWLRRVRGEQVDMKQHNPVYIPRNHVVNAVIDDAVKRRDCTGLRKLVNCLANPYTRSAEFAKFELAPTTSERVAQTFCGT